MKIDGNLTLNSDASGQIYNVYLEQIPTAPAFSSSQLGRIYFDTSHKSYFYNNGLSWTAFSSGGSGSGGSSTLAGLTDVLLTSLASSQYLQYNSSTGKWNNTTLVLSNVTDVHATSAEVNVLHGFTGTTANLNILASTTASAADLNSITGYATKNISATIFGYLGGVTPVTSSIQGQINNLQAANAGLNAFGTFANGSSTGIVVKTGVDTFADITLTSNTSNLIISNPAGPANPTFSLAGNLGSLASLSGVGLLTLNGTTLGVQALSAGAGINIANATGIFSPTISLAPVTQSSGGTLLKTAVDGYGRVISNSAAVITDLTSLIGTYYLPTVGGSMTGQIIFNNTSGTTITGLPLPINSSDVATKSYVDAAASSLVVHSAVAVATTTNLNLTYSNGTSGVGATLTSSSALTSIDGVNLAVSMRVLIKDQTAQWQNGVYTVTSLGSTVFTRATDANTGSAAGITHGFYVYVNGGGTTNGNTSWTETANGSGSNSTFIIGTDSIVFTQFSSAGSYLAGAGLTLNGGVFSVDYGAGITALPSGDVGLNVYGNGALILTTSGTTNNPIAGSALALLLTTNGGLSQGTTGLSIATAGVTNAMLAHSTVALVCGTGSGSLSLGGTLSVLGDGAAISTSVTNSAITISAAKATTSSVGVAQFINSTFAVSTSGQVSIVPGAITNTQLVNSSWGINGTTGGTQSITLGTNLSVLGGSSAITTVSSSGTLTINVATATTTTLGLSSFASTYFSVNAGAVSIQTTLGSGALTNVASTVDSPANGDILQYNSTTSKWANVPIAIATNQKATYYLYTATSALTTHTVVHNLGQQYPIVQVIDQTSTNLNQGIMPASIYFQDANTAVVTFTNATLCKIAVVS